SLRPLYDRLSELLRGNKSQEGVDDHPNMIVLDGISMLEWSGTPILEVKRFIRALRTLCRKNNTALVIRHHRVSSSHLDDLQRSLLSQCALHLEVLPLASGRSSVISGEIALHSGPLLDDPNSFTPIHRNAAIQYRLRDAGATYFGRGTSAVVL
ncbi:uncharacterized protein FOMMEDRAFT_82171, partial [Fomitiporia mediterranea MF3/22]|uniref:uncharacterized protein n=1 Tax=Fomitiporia mediterranea (strain MF3/22) TaxID=694068 RepID=UPI00044081D9